MRNKSTSAKRHDSAVDLPEKHPNRRNVSPSIDSDDSDLDVPILTRPSTGSTLNQGEHGNQEMHVDAETMERLQQLLFSFRAPIRFAFAYGSGVFSQGGSQKQRPMIDLIFGVSFTQHWHSLNLAQHRDHYSFMSKLGSGAVAYVQDNFGAGVYFNPYVELHGTVC